MNRPDKPDINAIFREGVEIDRAMQRAARQARMEHKMMRVPLVIWVDGKTVLVPPDEIVIDDEPEEPSQQTP